MTVAIELNDPRFKSVHIERKAGLPLWDSFEGYVLITYYVDGGCRRCGRKLIALVGYDDHNLGDYIYSYLSNLKKEMNINDITILLEREYVDKYYLKDYAKYYAEGFADITKYTQRLHFFSIKIGSKKLKDILKKRKKEDIEL